ncbi:hypothetical protein [Nonomuraea sp. NPDC049400]|uniref:hypothetical protein n=1 Tax=Nonomuraea sp. NPDC049400 TaxID=3364352 RepID=UPI0037B58F9E
MPGRRGVAFALDGLRAEAAQPLPTAPLALQQVYEVMRKLTGTPWHRAGTCRTG